MDFLIIICGILLISLIMTKVALYFINIANLNSERYVVRDNTQYISKSEKENYVYQKVFDKNIGEYVEYEDLEN